MTMDEGQRKLYEQSQELERYKQLEKQQKAQEEKQRNEENQRALQNHYSNVVSSIMNESGLPKTAFVQQQVIQGLKILVEKGYSAEQIGDGKALIPYVKKQWENHQKALWAEPEEVARMAPEAKEKWRKFLNDEYNKAQKGNVPPSHGAAAGIDTPKPQSASKSKKTIADFDYDREAFLDWKRSQLND